MKRRGLVFFLSLVMVIAMLPTVAFAAEFSDMPKDWSTEALESAVANGLLTGADGKLMPKESLTRAQMAAIINRAFGATQKAELNSYTDVVSSAWYYDDLAKAVQMKTFVGSGDKLNPNTNITREEAFVVLARAFKQSGGSERALDKFSDKSAISSWARDGVASLASAGYVTGANGQLHPKQNITRAQFAQIMHNLLQNYIKTAGTYSEISQGNVMINVPDVTLKNITVQGDLIIGDGAGEGDITLDNVKVTGRMVVRGGGINSIKIIGNSELSSVIISKVNGKVRVVTESGARVKVIYIDDGKDDVVIQGKIGSIEVAAPNVPVMLQNAQVDNVTVTAPKVKLMLGNNTTVNTVTVSPMAQGATITADTGATIINVKAEAASTSIDGEGTIQNASIQGNNSRINTIGTKIEVGKEVSGTTSGGTLVAGGTSGTTTATGVTTPSSNGGGSGGGTSTVAVSAITVTPTTMSLTAGGAIGTIIATVDPSNATNKNVTWISSNEAVATVVNGIVTPIASGAATITATSVADGTKTASAIVTVVAPSPDPDPIGPFTPGEGGSISKPSFTNEPGKIGGMYVLASHNYDSVWELILAFQPYVEYSEVDFTLQYSADDGETWSDATEFITWDDGDVFGLEPDAEYQYRMVSVGEEVYTSNIVMASRPEGDANIYLEINAIEYEDEGYVNHPFVGSSMEVYSEMCDSNYEELSEELSYQWYRVNPVTFEMIPIADATGTSYTRTEADAGYLLLARAFSENYGVYAQELYRYDWNSRFTIIPNKAYITNLNENGFTLNLYRGVDSILPEDLYLYAGDSDEPLAIDAVTVGENSAIYQVAVPILEDYNYLCLYNDSNLWWIVTESEEAGIYSWLEISKGQTVDISTYVNDGTVAGPETLGFTIDNSSGAEKINVSAGTSTKAKYNFTITHTAQGTVQAFEVYCDFYNWTVAIQNTVLNVSNQIGAGSAAQLQGVSGFTLSSGAKNVTIDETVNVRNSKFYFDVSGGINDGKRYKVFYDDYWKVEEVTALITTVEITGPDSIEIKRYGATPDTAYMAVVMDQNGEEITDEKITWSLKAPLSGVSVGANNGIVTVAYYPSVASFTLVATSGTDNTVKAEKTIAVTLQDRREKVITETTVGVLSDGNLDVVPAETKVSELKAGLTVSAGATVEILAATGGSAVADQENTVVNGNMVIKVTAEEGTIAEYTITMATYTIKLKDGSLIDIIGTTIDLPGDALISPDYGWLNTARAVYIYRTGTGDITNLQVVSSDLSKFDVLYDHPVNPPGQWTDTLTKNRTSTLFYVYAVEGLPSGEHTGTFTVTADNGISESFNVRFRVA